MKHNPLLTKKELLLLLAAVGYNCLIYNGGRFIARNFYHYDLTTCIDKSIPFLPWMILTYWFCYLYWAVNYIIGVKFEKKEKYQFISAHFVGLTVCFLCFVFFPTTMTRPEVGNKNIFDKIMRLTYAVDQPDNLFPSIHCFASWLCWIAVRGNKKVPKWYQIFSFIFACQVCFCTLTVKQHLISDVVAGILLAEICYFVDGIVIRAIRIRKQKKEVSE